MLDFFLNHGESLGEQGLVLLRITHVLASIAGRDEVFQLALPLHEARVAGNQHSARLEQRDYFVTEG